MDTSPQPAHRVGHHLVERPARWTHRFSRDAAFAPSQYATRCSVVVFRSSTGPSRGARSGSHGADQSASRRIIMASALALMQARSVNSPLRSARPPLLSRLPQPARNWSRTRQSRWLGVTMGSMSASDAAPLPRLGEVFFDVRGSSRSMRLSWYADLGVADFRILQA